VVEGVYDIPVYEELIRKIMSADVEIISRPAGGVTRLMRLFPVLLRDLEHVRQGRSVDKALVIRDSGGRDPASVERQMADKVRSQSFSFPRGLRVHAVRRAMETWLLADANAISFVASSRGVASFGDGRPVSEVQGVLEDIEDPKGRFKRLLTTVRLPYDPEVCRQIARQIDIEKLRYRCPSFVAFEKKVIDD
jgi:hypothetical protein